MRDFSKYAVPIDSAKKIAKAQRAKNLLPSKTNRTAKITPAHKKIIRAVIYAVWRVGFFLIMRNICQKIKILTANKTKKV